MSCNEWQKVKLGDLIESISVKHSFNKNKLIFLNTSDILEGKVLHNNYSDIEGLPGQAKKSIKKDDILFSEIRPKNKRFAYVDFDSDDYVVSTKLMVLRKKSNNINNRYLYYYLTSDKTLNYLQTIAEGRSGTFPQITFNELKIIEIDLPPLEEQEKIANILSSLDDKIELNNEMNKTLEEMAQSLFKRWFVDFEFPNEDGEPYKSSGGEMVDSELGMIPKGWEVKKISELIEVKDGTHASPKVSKEGFPLVTSKHIKGDRIAIEDAKIISEKDYLEVNKRSKVDTGDILISMIGTVGLTYFVQEEEINFAIKNIGLFKTSQNKTLSEYFYLYLKSDNMKNYIEARLAGTTQKYISLGELRNIPVVLPNDSIIDKFKKVVGVLLDKRRLNIINNEELMITRDTLLPKLMNGEIMI